MNINVLCQAALQNLPGVSVLLFDHDLRYTLVSDQPEPPFHQAACIGQPLPVAMPTAYVEAFQAAYLAALDGTAQAIDYTYEDQVYTVQVQPVRDAQGQILGGMVIAPLTGKTIAFNHQRYQALFDQTNDAVFVLDFDGRHLEWNQRAADLLGYTSAELSELTNSALVSPEEMTHSQQQLAALLSGGEVPVYERRFIHKSGREIVTEVNLTLVRDVAGQPQYIQSIVRDITERKRAEMALRTSEERYRIISELMSDYAYLFRLEPDGTQVLEWVTDSMTRVTGYTVDELLNQQLQLIHPDDNAWVQADIQRAVAGEFIAACEYRIFDKMGQIRWIRIARHPIWDDAEQRVTRLYNVAQDITQGKEAEAALMQSEERFRLITQATTDGLYDCDLVAGTVWRNDWYVRYLGLTSPISGRGVWAPALHPDDHDEILASHRTTLAGNANSWTGEYRLRGQDGNYRIFTDRTYIVRDQQGRAIRAMGAVTDVTEAREHEQRALELRVQTERIEMLTKFIRAMSHDFRTPLTVINTSIYLLNRSNDPARQQLHLDKIQDQVGQLEKLIDGLRTMAILDSDDVFEFQPLDVNRLVEYVQTHEGPKCEEKGINLYVKTGTDLPRIFGDENWLHHALTSLVENAIQFTPSGNTITLRTDQQADCILVEVQDTGIGMTEAQQQAIFTPLYRAAEHRPADNGYGSGLPIAYKIINEHQGRIELESVPNQGTTFRILLPVKTL